MRLIDILHSPWAITPNRYQEICEIYGRHLRGEKIDLSGLEARLGVPLDNQYEAYTVTDGVAVVPVQGVIARRMNMFTRISGGTSSELLARDIQAAISDPAVKEIVLDIDSPGGAVDGTQNAAQIIYEARGKKPIVAVANELMASAAYWIGSAAEEIYAASDTSQIGSIGVVTRHIDSSKLEERVGYKTTVLTAGKYKAMGHEFEPLSAESREYIQQQLDHTYSVFVGAVAAHRGVSVGYVLDHMAEGRIFQGNQAVEAGLVDGVASLESVINDLISRRSGGGSGGAKAKTKRAKQTIGVIEMSQTTEITKGFILENHPEIAEAFRAEGREEVNAEAIKKQSYVEGYNAGKVAEVERVKGVFAASLPGYESLIQSMAVDGETTPMKAAQRVIEAQRATLSKVASNLHADEDELPKVPQTTAPGATSASGQWNSQEQQIKGEWDRDASLRAEFGDDFECFEAFRRNQLNGNVRIKNS